MEFIDSSAAKEDELVSFGKPSDRELLANQWEDSHPSLAYFGKDFFINGTVPSFKRGLFLENLRVAFEDGTFEDHELMYLMRYADFAVLRFLLFAAHEPITADQCIIAARCLAFAGNIDETIWSSFMHKTKHLDAIIAVTDTLLTTIQVLLSVKSPLIPRKSYIGYDKRDKAEYNTEGYDEEEAERDKGRQEKADREDQIMTILLLIAQFFFHPVELISIRIENFRDQQANLTSSSMLKVESEELTLDSFVPLLLDIAQRVLGFTKIIFEDGSQQCIKIIAAMSSQFPLINQQTTEIGEFFTHVDYANSDGGLLQQGLLYLLNENGYPNMSKMEALNAIRLCMNVLYVKINDTNSSRGNFYSNDLKVLLEICLRELTNLPKGGVDHSFQALRLSYVNLMQVTLVQTDCLQYAEPSIIQAIKDLFTSMITSEDEDEQCRLMTEEFFDNYPTLLN